MLFLRNLAIDEVSVRSNAVRERVKLPPLETDLKAKVLHASKCHLNAIRGNNKCRLLNLS